jgi:lipopolysaccharide O-acetyltransferase
VYLKVESALSALGELVKKTRGIGLYGFIRLSFNYIVSKIFFPSARIVRLPFYLRKEGNINIGSGFSSNAGLIIDSYGEDSVITIGKNVMANYRLHIGCIKKIIIGENTLFGSDCLVIDHSHGDYGKLSHSSPLIPPSRRELFYAPVVIGSNCWLGDQVSVMPGVSIGDGVVIGAGSVVVKDIPPYSIAVGVPAVVIKKYDFNTKQWHKV